MSFMLHVKPYSLNSYNRYMVYRSNQFLLCKEVTRRGRDEGEKKEVVIIK